MIKEDNKRIAVTIPKKIHEKLKNEAEYEGRSVSGMAAIIIKSHYRNKKNKNKLL